MPALGLYALVGVLAGLWIPLPGPDYLAVFLLLASGSLAWWFAGARLLVGVLAFFLSGLHGHWYLQAALPESLIRADILVRGIVIDFPRTDTYSTKFLLRTDRSIRKSGLPEYLYLASYLDDLTPQAGEQWQLLVRLKGARGLANPGLHDRALWLFRQGINATGYVRESRLNQRLEGGDSGYYVLRLRAELSARLKHAVGAHDAFPLLLGITLGIRQLLEASHWDTLRRTGTSHLLAISGLHLGMVAVAMWQLGRWLGWLFSFLSAANNSQRWARILAGGSVLVYGMLAGFSIPTVRAACMALLILMLAARQRAYTPTAILGCVLLVALTIDPLVTLSAGFWLSYCAVALLFICIKRALPWEQAGIGPSSAVSRLLLRAWQILTGWAGVQVVLTLGLAVPGLIFFNQLSLVSPLANLVAIPMFSIGVLPASLIGVMLISLGISAGATFLSTAATGLSLLMIFLQKLALLPGSFWQPHGLGLTGLLAFGAGIVCLLLPRPVPLRSCGIFIIAVGLYPGNPAIDEQLRLDVLDVGQGMAIIVRVGGKVMLYDTGPGWRGANAGQQIVVPVLRHLGIEKVDTLVISHWDSDHSGGAVSVAESVLVERILAPVPASLQIGQIDLCRRGLTWSWGAARFEILHPANPDGWSDNNASCVVLVRLGRQAILLPGDIESAVEALLVHRYSLEGLQLVVVPHHGSSTSSSAEFVAETRPEYAVYSSGYANRWGFPHAVVRQRWKAAGSCTMATADSGAISFVLNAETGLMLVNFARAGWTRPWPLRLPYKSACKAESTTL